MYSICSAPFDSNPDWCQLLVLILFAPHPFCAVTLNVTLIHLPSPTASLGFQTQCLLKLQSVPQSRASARTTGLPLFFVPHSYFPIFFVTSSLSLSLFLNAGLRLQHLWGSGVSRGSRAGVESRSNSLWGGKSPGSAGHRTIYSPQTVPGLCLSAC